MSSDSPHKPILVLGAGELGLSVLKALAAHPQVAVSVSNPTSTPTPQSPGPLTILLRSNPARLATLSALQIPTISSDLTIRSLPQLVKYFRPYHTIISCVGFSAPAGTQLDLARAVIEAGVKCYIPWQFGLDYDAVGRGSGQDLFDEQLDVRHVLRQQQGTEWVIVTTGLFTSFLFGQKGFVLDLDLARLRDSRKEEENREKVVVTGLGSWDNEVTVTDVGDIATVVAELVLTEGEWDRVRNRVVYTAGERISYARLAELVREEVAVAKSMRKPADGKDGEEREEEGGDLELERELLTVPMLEDLLRQNPGDGLVKYRLVFARGKGVAWDVEKSWNYQHGMKVLDVKEGLRRYLAEA